LSVREFKRYGRQLVEPLWSEGAQRRLKQAVVFVAGAGGLGSPVILYLAAAGVGCLRVCDSGRVEPSNLNRQILYSEHDIGKAKAGAARRTVRKLNPFVHVVPLNQNITGRTVSSVVADSHLMVDCLDNFETRYVLNAFAVENRIPLIHGGVRGFEGQLSFIHPPHTPCLACMVPEEPPLEETFPVLGATAGVIGSLQALEALKYLTGTGDLLAGRMLFWNGRTVVFHVSRERKNPDCRVCGFSSDDSY
jgi:molybdopterin/thiamine biosynthesis adenylyltransferase